jgi:hypothetical protein
LEETVDPRLVKYVNPIRADVLVGTLDEAIEAIAELGERRLRRDIRGPRELRELS